MKYAAIKAEDHLRPNIRTVQCKQGAETLVTISRIPGVDSRTVPMRGKRNGNLVLSCHRDRDSHPTGHRHLARPMEDKVNPWKSIDSNPAVHVTTVEEKAIGQTCVRSPKDKNNRFDNKTSTGVLRTINRPVPLQTDVTTFVLLFRI
jgi:hypothetical protein